MSRLVVPHMLFTLLGSGQGISMGSKNDCGASCVQCLSCKRCRGAGASHCLTLMREYSTFSCVADILYLPVPNTCAR